MINFNIKQDQIAFIAPASGCKDADGNMDEAQSFKRLHATIKFFKKNDFKCSYDKKIFLGDDLEYFSAPKDERIRQLKAAIEDPKVKIIYAFRGGYGCSEIVFDCMAVVPSGPKIMIGFSDITVLHLLFSQHYNFPSIHGSMDSKNIKMLEKVVSVLKGGDTIINLQSLTSKGKDSSLTGNMAGGNLTVLCTMIGTELQPITKGKILFIEDINETGYKIHRHLVHMHNAGLFESVKGVIFGDFFDTSLDIDPTILSFADEYLADIPVYKTSEFGHGDINNPIVIGATGKIVNNRLTIPSPFTIK